MLGHRRGDDSVNPHPLANLLPLITGAEFDALVTDIGEHGLRVPITLFNDRVLDGRNRLRACEVELEGAIGVRGCGSEAYAHNDHRRFL